MSTFLGMLIERRHAIMAVILTLSWMAIGVINFMTEQKDNWHVQMAVYQLVLMYFAGSMVKELRKSNLVKEDEDVSSSRGSTLLLTLRLLFLIGVNGWLWVAFKSISPVKEINFGLFDVILNKPGVPVLFLCSCLLVLGYIPLGAELFLSDAQLMSGDDGDITL